VGSTDTVNKTEVDEWQDSTRVLECGGTCFWLVTYTIVLPSESRKCPQ